MGGLFGGGDKKKSSNERQTTASSIETKDGAIYDRRTSAPMTDQKSATDNIMDPLGGSKKTEATLSTDPLDAMMSRQNKSKTIAGAPGTYSFG
jgi:hypothetical protein